jgi:hypothetical protein
VQDVIFQQDGYRVVLSSGLFFHATKAPRKGERISARLPLECLGLEEGV